MLPMRFVLFTENFALRRFCISRILRMMSAVSSRFQAVEFTNFTIRNFKKKKKRCKTLCLPVGLLVFDNAAQRRGFRGQIRFGRGSPNCCPSLQSQDVF